MSLTTDLAAAVVTAINAADLSQDVTAERVPLVDEKLTATGDLQVLVAPAKRTRDLETRGEDAYIVEIDVAVLQKLSAVTTTVVDVLDEFQEEIEDEFFREDVTAADAVVWTCTGVRTLEGAEAGYAWQMMRTPRVYLGISRLTFQRVD